jgi:CubicO group peptidase (beta-lactamase class C family)
VKRPVLALVVLALAGCAGTAPSSAPTQAASSQAAVPAAPSTAPTFEPSPTASPDVEARLDTLFGTDFNGSALIAKDGMVVYVKGIGMADDATKLANTPDTRFRIGSLTKQFTAMASLLLETRGLVKGDDSICDYIDHCPKTWKAVTIEHLLGHSSGIANFTDQPEFDETKAATPAETVASVADIPLAWTPGEFFGYTNTGYVLLGMAIERASGKPYEQFLQDEIFGPLGMKDSGYEHGETPGLAVGYSEGFTVAHPLDMSVPYAAGGLYSTVLDLQRWEEALYTEQLAPSADMARYFTPLMETTDRGGFGYAYGQYVGDQRGAKLVWHDGGINGFYTQLNRYPDDHITVALLTNRESSPDLGSLAQVAAAIVRGGP